jgi:hypothetical protein
MASRQPTSKPTWAHVKAELQTFDRPGLLALIQDFGKVFALFLATNAVQYSPLFRKFAWPSKKSLQVPSVRASGRSSCCPEHAVAKKPVTGRDCLGRSRANLT